MHEEGAPTSNVSNLQKFAFLHIYRQTHFWETAATVPQGAITTDTI